MENEDSIVLDSSGEHEIMLTAITMGNTGQLNRESRQAYNST